MNLRWLQVGCVAVAVALVGIVIVVSMSGDSREGSKTKSAEAQQIPTVQPNLRKSNVAAAVPVEKAQTKRPTTAAVAPAAKKERKPRGAFQPEAPEVAAMRKRVKEIKVNWATTAEVSLSGMLSYEPGDMYIERDFNDAFMKNLTVALVTPIVIEEDDHPLVKQKKEDMIALKEQMKDILDREGVKGLKAELVAAQADLMRANSLVKDMKEGPLCAFTGFLRSHCRCASSAASQMQRKTSTNGLRKTTFAIAEGGTFSRIQDRDASRS